MTARSEMKGSKVAPALRPNIFDYHSRALTIGKNGVNGFFMPVSEAAADRMLSRVLADSARFLTNVGIDVNRTAEAIWLVLIYLALEAVSTFVAMQVVAGNQARGVQAKYGGDDGILTRIGRGKTFESAIVARLQNRKFTPSLVRTWGRFARTFVNAENISRKPPALIDRANDIVCFAAVTGQRRLAAEQGLRLVLSHPENWFAEFQRELSRSSTDLAEGLITQVTEIVTDAFRAEGVQVPDCVCASLRANCGEIVRTGAAMRAALERNRRRLPREFWASSMGPLHNRVLARAVQKEGGSVAAFDHGVGCGWMDAPELLAYEWDFCDRFFSFSETSARAVKGLIARGAPYGVSGRECAVSASPIPLYDLSLASRGAQSTGGRKKLSVWYVPTVYSQERAYMPPTPPDIIAVDFQAGLLRQLSDLGHEIVVKPHPECTVGVPPDLLSRAGVRLETGLFESVLNEADVVILDYPQSTTFRSTILAGVPLVILNPGRASFLPEALVPLRGRAAVVPIERSAENRRFVDPARLAGAIAEAPQLTGDAFQRAYYPGS